MTGCTTCSGNRYLNKKDQTCLCPNEGYDHLAIETPFCSTCDTAVMEVRFSDNVQNLIVTFIFEVEIYFDFKVDY